MTPTDGLLTFSFPMGRLLGVPLRLSFLLPFVVAALMWRLGDFVFGALVGVIVLFSLLLHETAHLLMLRRCGQHPGAVIIWPLGGLYSARIQSEFRGALACAFAGPAVSLSVAAVAGGMLAQRGLLDDLLNPFVRLDLRSDCELPLAVLRSFFIVNWCLGLLNLIPVQPLDAGRGLFAFLSLRFSERESADLMLRLGLVVSLFGLLSGFVFDLSSVVALSAFILVLHLHELSQWEPASSASEDQDGFSGYDFSEGDRSWARSQNDSGVMDLDRRSEDSIIERWKSRRDEERERRELNQQAADEAELDAILEKLHESGRDSLTPRELMILDRVSARLRQRGVGQQRP